MDGGYNGWMIFTRSSRGVRNLLKELNIMYISHVGNDNHCSDITICLDRSSLSWEGNFFPLSVRMIRHDAGTSNGSSSCFHSVGDLRRCTWTVSKYGFLFFAELAGR